MNENRKYGLNCKKLQKKEPALLGQALIKSIMTY